MIVGMGSKSILRGGGLHGMAEHRRSAVAAVEDIAGIILWLGGWSQGFARGARGLKALRRRMLDGGLVGVACLVNAGAWHALEGGLAALALMHFKRFRNNAK